MSQDGEHGYFMRSASDVCGQLTRAVPPTRLLCASQPRCTRMSFWVVMIYFWFVKTLRWLHYQLLSPMSFMNLCHLGLTLPRHRRSVVVCSRPLSLTLCVVSEHDDISHLIFVRGFFFRSGHPFHLGVNTQVQNPCELDFG